MTLGQLYYTSCEHGLSGFAGYQFNAATPGITLEVMRDVETLTAYEPPRSMPYEPTPADIAAAPVNLCHRPRPADGGSAVVANVVFVGADFSRRYGNYFAHALVSESPDKDLPMLPIELWRAPLWVRDPAVSTELPALSVAHRDIGLDRRQVEAAIDNHRHRGLLASLLSAAERAIVAGERSVVIVESDADAAARWIAQISYLLPPPMARRMSFATYQHRPSYSRLHVLGTVPDADVDLSDTAFADFHLYDMVGGRASEVAVHPVAERLAGLGPLSVESLWRRLPDLADGDEDTFDRWHPVLSAAALLAGRQLERSDLETVTGWLSARATRLGPGLVTELGEAVLAQPAAGTMNPRDLLAAAREVGAPVSADIERNIVDADLDAIRRTGAPAPVMSAPPLSGPALEHAAVAAEHAIRSADAGTRAALLVWAYDLGVHLASDLLLECGVRSVGPLLARGPIDEDLTRALRGWHDLRWGLVSYLDSGADDRQVLRVLENGAAELLSDDDVRTSPRLREPLLIVSDRRARTAPEETLRRVLHLRAAAGGPAPADAALLGTLWGGRPWTVEEALGVLRGVRPEWLGDRAVGHALAAPLTAGLAADGTADAADAYFRLCMTVRGHPAKRLLDPEARRVLEDVPWIQELTRKGEADPRATRRAADALARHLGDMAPAVQNFGTPYALRLLDRVRPEELSGLLARAAPDLRSAYLGRISRRLAGSPPDIALAARVFVALHGRSAGRASGLTDALLADALSSWRRRDLDALAREWEDTDPLRHGLFTEWRHRHLAGRRIGLKLPWVRASRD